MMKKEQFTVEEIDVVKKIRERLAAAVHDEDYYYTYGEFLGDWKQFKEGQISNHDLYCKLVHVFYDIYHQDFLSDLKNFFIYSDEEAAAATTVTPTAASTLPGQSCCVN